MNGALTRACKNCEWWVARYADLGACHGLPPVQAPREEVAKWPVTLDIDWCGHFRAAERLSGNIDIRSFRETP